MAVKPNELIGGYHFAQKIGEGATATVWLAREKDTSLPVSIKLLKSEVFPPSSAQATYERLVGAVTHAGRLTHQGLAQVRTTFHEPRRGLYGIVSEYLDGQSLDRFRLPKSDDGKPDPRAVVGMLTWFQQLAAVLAWLHTNGLVHGSVKPSNVVLMTGYERPHVKLLDLCWSLALNEGNRVTAADDQRAAAKVLQSVIISSAPEESATRALALAPVTLLKVVQRAIQPDPKQQFADMGAFFYAIEAVRNELEASGSASQKGPGDPTQPTERVSPVSRQRAGGSGGAVAAQRVLADVRPEPAFDLSGGNYVEIGPKRGSAPLPAKKKVDRFAPLIGVDPSATEEAEAIDGAGGKGTRMALIAALSLLIAAGVAWGAIRFFGQDPVQLDSKTAVLVPAADPTPAALERAEAEAKRAAVEETARQAAAADEASEKAKAEVEAKAKADADAAAKAKADAEAAALAKAKTDAEAAALAKAKAETAAAVPVPKSNLDADCKSGKASACLERAEELAAADQVETAAATFERACDLGKLNGCMKAGELYEKQNGKRARRTYEKACDRRIAQACELLSRLYAKGIGGPANERAATAFKSRACGLGLKSACK